jgi:hypothetical protein
LGIGVAGEDLAGVVLIIAIVAAWVIFAKWKPPTDQPKSDL